MSSIHVLHRETAGGNTRDLRRTGLHPDFWYPLARASDVKPGKTLGVHFGGEPIVLVRPAEGAAKQEVFALEDRCAHRQVPLHLGVVKGEKLLCGYHCWAYNRTGACINVPYLDEKQTLPNGVRRYASREAYGFIFVFTGDQALAASTPFPELPAYDNPAYKARLLDRKIGCHYSFMHENLMDMNHQYLHRSLMGSIRTTLLDVREGEDWLEADYTFSRASGKQNLGERFIIGRGNSEKPKEGTDLMTIRTGYPYQTLKFWTAGSEEPALSLWNAYIPTDREQRINQTYGVIMIKKPGIPGMINVLWPFIYWFTKGIFDQDRHIVEAEQRAYDMQGADLNQEVFPAIQRLKNLLARRGVPLAAR
ncbi:MAG TPA: aromatic ring-hydroxylating dioxygenase subunit alpha [Nevskia sp.]|nr:aromatic ring-hydroxylating dioxygenase subunit alpha [Nevskia sp.]